MKNVEIAKWVRFTFVETVVLNFINVDDKASFYTVENPQVDDGE